MRTSFPGRLAPTSSIVAAACTATRAASEICWKGEIFSGSYLQIPKNTSSIHPCLLTEVSKAHAGVAELADALASGASGLRPVKVQVLSPAPSNRQAPSGVPFRVSGYYGRAGRDFVSRNISAIIEYEKILPIRNKFIDAFH